MRDGVTRYAHQIVTRVDVCADAGHTDPYSFACQFYMYAYPGRMCLTRKQGITRASGGEGAFDGFLVRMMEAFDTSASVSSDFKPWSEEIRNVTRL